MTRTATHPLLACCRASAAVSAQVVQPYRLNTVRQAGSCGASLRRFGPVHVQSQSDKGWHGHTCHMGASFMLAGERVLLKVCDTCDASSRQGLWHSWYKGITCSSQTRLVRSCVSIQDCRVVKGGCITMHGGHASPSKPTSE